MAVILRRRKLGLTSCREIARQMSNNCAVLRNDRAAAQIGLAANGNNYVFRWGCTALVPNEAKVVNTVEAIQRVNDKTGFRRILDEHNLCPKTWFDFDEFIQSDEITGMMEQGWYFLHDKSYIVRPSTHAQGRQLYHCVHPDNIEDAVERCGDGYYISEYIPKVAEYRVFVAQGRVVWVAQKTPGNPDDIAWNVARGGRFDNVRFGEWPLRVVKCAIEGFNLSGLDFGGVDVMVDAEGRPYILEINSAPSQTSPYRQSCVAKVFDYIIENGKGNIPLTEARGGWRKFIHPAVSDEAIVQ